MVCWGYETLEIRRSTEIRNRTERAFKGINEAARYERLRWSKDIKYASWCHEVDNITSIDGIRTVEVAQILPSYLFGPSFSVGRNDE